MKVHEAIRVVEKDGWYLVATRGSPPIQAFDQTRPRDHCRQAVGGLGAWNAEQYHEAAGLKEQR